MERKENIAERESLRLIRMIKTEIIIEDRLPNKFPEYTGVLEHRDYEIFLQWLSSPLFNICDERRKN